MGALVSQQAKIIREVFGGGPEGQQLLSFLRDFYFGDEDTRMAALARYDEIDAALEGTDLHEKAQAAMQLVRDLVEGLPHEKQALRKELDLIMNGEKLPCEEVSCDE